MIDNDNEFCCDLMQLLAGWRSKLSSYRMFLLLYVASFSRTFDFTTLLTHHHHKHGKLAALIRIKAKSISNTNLDIIFFTHVPARSDGSAQPYFTISKKPVFVDQAAVYRIVPISQVFKRNFWNSEPAPTIFRKARESDGWCVST